MTRTPQPLTATSPAHIDFSRPSGPVATGFDDIYYSVDNGLEESRCVYLAACQMPHIWKGRDRFTVGELGFGTGLNFLALWKMWKEHRPSPNARLNVFSVEGFPLSKDELAQSIGKWGELKEFSAALISKWPGCVKGRHILEFDDGVTLTLCHDHVDDALDGFSFLADSWFLDGFSPAKNPQMWSSAIMAKVFGLSAPGAQIGTFTVAGAVVRSLSSAGFETQKKVGHGKKRHRLEAIKPGAPPKARAAPSPIILGGGIAGASLARSFLRRGITPTLIDPQIGDGASLNPIAIVKPRLDLQDRPESRFFLSAYLYALQAYGEPYLNARGAGNFARDVSEQERFMKLADQAALPRDEMQYLPADAFQERIGIRAPLGGLWFPKAPNLKPKELIADWIKGATIIKSKASRLDGQTVLDAQSNIIASGSDIIIAAGCGAIPLAETLPLIPIKGQIDWGAYTGALKKAIGYGGYAAPYKDGLLIGSTHERGKVGSKVSVKNTQLNSETFKTVSGETFLSSQSRASVRVGTLNGLPIAKTLRPGLHIISALAGRGFSHAPLLAEQMAAKICEEYFSVW